MSKGQKILRDHKKVGKKLLPPFHKSLMAEAEHRLKDLAVDVSAKTSEFGLWDDPRIIRFAQCFFLSFSPDDSQFFTR